MTRLLYSIAYLLALPLVFPAQYAKRPKQIKSIWLSQKLGKVEPVGGDSDAPLLWVHAVSVGEAIAAATFIRAFIKRHPDYRVVVSTITDTGQKVASERLADLAEVIYLPFDLPVFLNRAINTLKPSLFVVMETEIWPNLFHCMKRAGVPVALLNGRISEKSFKSYMKIRPALKSVLKDVDLFSMQDAVYAERITELGADPGRVHEAGSFKFDMDISASPLPWADAFKGAVIVAGSTHRGEDELIADAYVRLKTTHEALALILVPRHPERSDEVEAMLKARGISCQRLSAISQGARAAEDVVLVDMVGELTAIYERADIAVIGGSFIPHGGQNPLEPAYWGKAIVCGPHMHNFPFIDDFYDAGAAIESSPDDLGRVMEGLLNSPQRRESMGNKASGLLDKSRGAVLRALDMIDALPRN